MIKPTNEEAHKQQDEMKIIKLNVDPPVERPGVMTRAMYKGGPIPTISDPINRIKSKNALASFKINWVLF